MGDFSPVNVSLVYEDKIKFLNSPVPIIDQTRKAKILMLHGNARSGRVFEGKTRFIKELLENVFPPFPAAGFHPQFSGGIELHYPTATHPIRPVSDHTKHNSSESEFDAWARGKGEYLVDKIERYDESVRYMLKYIWEKGPFDGIVSFSLGATMAFSLISLSERASDSKLLQALKVETDVSDLSPPDLAELMISRSYRHHSCILSSGFIMQHPLYRSLYYPKIQTATLHTIGKFDGLINVEHTEKLAGRCENSETIYHDGAHFVPRTKMHQKSMLEFIKEAVGSDARKSLVSSMLGISDKSA